MSKSRKSLSVSLLSPYFSKWHPYIKDHVLIDKSTQVESGEGRSRLKIDNIFKCIVSITSDGKLNQELQILIKVGHYWCKTLTFFQRKTDCVQDNPVNTDNNVAKESVRINRVCDGFLSPGVRDGPLEKLWGGREFSSCKNFFSLSNSLHEFYLGHCMNIF